MNDSKIESGLQLITRVNEAQCMNTLKFIPLFPNGIYPKEYIEITGECNVGKSFLLLDFVVSAILPKTLNNILLPGNDVQVAFINTDHHINIGHIANAVERSLKEHLKVCPPTSNVEECLAKITLLNCYDSDQLKFTILNLEYILQRNKQIRLIVLDSIGSYFWMDRVDLGNVSFNNYCSTVRNALVNTVNEFSLNVIYTKVKVPTQIEGNHSKNDYCISLRILENGNYMAEVKKEQNVTLQLEYTLEPFLTFCK